MAEEKNNIRLLSIILILSGGILFLGYALLYLTSVLPFIRDIILQIGVMLLGAGAIQLAFQYSVEKSLVNDISNKICETMKLPLESFYEERKAMPQLKDELAESSEVWAAWWTGSIISREDTLKVFSSKNPRIIITNPESLVLEEVAKIVHNNVTVLKQDILFTISKAQESNINLRLFNGSIGHSVIISDPNSDRNKGWARIEFLVPYGDVNARPSIKVSQQKGNKTFQQIVKWHETMWEESVTPQSLPKSKESDTTPDVTTQKKQRYK